MVRVRIRSVEMPSEDASPVVVLEEASGGGEFSVAVGAAEAGAILLELEGIATPLRSR